MGCKKVRDAPEEWKQSFVTFLLGSVYLGKSNRIGATVLRKLKKKLKVVWSQWSGNYICQFVILFHFFT